MSLSLIGNVSGPVRVRLNPDSSYEFSISLRHRFQSLPLTMKKTSSLLLALLFGLVAVFPATDALGKKKAPPDETPEGLVRSKDAKADLVYLLPGVDFSGYDQVIILEPYIAFKKNWLNAVNSNRPFNDRISNRDMENIIEKGKDMFNDTFRKTLEKGGYPVVSTVDSNVLVLRPAIINLEIAAPDPNGIAGTWTKTYTDGAGEATLFLELYDSVSNALLARIYDTKSDWNDSFSWRIPRDQSSNKRDAYRALENWSKALVKGLDDAKAANSK